jgi:hypothetical protein
MHPDGHWISAEEKDSIAKAHQRLDGLIEQHLARVLAAQMLPGEAGEQARRDFPQASMISALHHRVLWWDTYINRGALDEQISNRVREEAKHFWLAVDEATLKLEALAELGAKVDKKLAAFDKALALFGVRENVINEAVPLEYKLNRLEVKRVHAAVKKALAA